MKIDRRVDVLVVAECPNVDVALERVREAATAAGVRVSTNVVRLDGDEDAKLHSFLGSPTVRVDGVDVDPSAKGRADYALQCRVYSVDGRLDGAPPTAWITAALRGAPPPRATASDATASCCGGKG